MNKTFIIAELSANHNNDFDLAVKTIQAMAKAGADAVKIQTYTADSLALDVNNKYFGPKKNGQWKGIRPYDLYKEASMPYEWQSKLKRITEDLGLVFFSSPFDFNSVDFLETLEVSLYKIASFEINDIPLIRYVASKGKPIIISTGVGDLEDIQLAVNTCLEVGNTNITLLKCTSQYPASLDQANLKTIPDLKHKFNTKVGVSDHSMGHTVPVVAVALGATVVEKHFILERSLGGPDSAFSMEPAEFRLMVDEIRKVEKTLGTISYDVSDNDKLKRRSLFAVEDIKKGDTFSKSNIRSLRPGHGLAPKYYDSILGKIAKNDFKKGDPITFDSNKVEIGSSEKSSNKKGGKKIIINMTRKMLILRILIIIPFLLVSFIGVNYFLDAENIYYQNYERVMARNVLDGKNITNISKYDDRIYQKYLITDMNDCPDIAIIGSSRTMMINNSYFQNKTLFNNSLNGYTIEDLVNVIMLYDKRGFMPKNIIIGIDPWLLNKKNYQNRWKSLAFEYNEALLKLGLDVLEIDSTYIHKNENKLFSFQYFMSSLAKQKKYKKSPKISDKELNKSTTKLKDGSITYSESFRNKSSKEIENSVKQFIKRKAFGFEGNKDFNQQNIIVFDKIIEFLNERKINIIFYFSPYHPIAFDYFSKKNKYKNFLEVEKYFTSYAQTKGIKCVGSFNPHILGIDSTYFFDAQNSNEKCVEKLVQDIKY